jgi:DNA helicase-2/ATP-dependent DNA helicase PcrA
MTKSADKSFPPLEEVLSFFRYKLRDKEAAFTKVQYERRLSKGISMLTDYYQARVPGWVKDVELEKWLQSVVSQVPIKGKIDKIERTEDPYCRVVDYKTGNPDSIYNKENLSAPNQKNPLGGNYWRQMVFYKLLVESQPFNKRVVNEGVFEYIEKSAKNLDYGHKVFILPADEETVLQQIKESYVRIKNLEFTKGCGKETCTWCNFIRDNRLQRPVTEDV